jgi:hypothetical protein
MKECDLPSADEVMELIPEVADGETDDADGGM